MKIFLEKNVWEDSLDRLRFLFDEFENIVVAFSGGKDSTVILNLALIVAKEKNRLPLKVMFIDQEAEWNAVVEYVRRTFSRKEIEPYWLQVPIRLFNATSMDEAFLNCWNQGEE
ncbi:MAG TPA: phosphoadenosine phosphosulfate reductase, partial [Aequorivita sp.]|nr:phosphoadenosine phosphosulfate reductase [Aequorivita sp.]